jgi:anti-sigma factor (TIGR02949 family)
MNCDEVRQLLHAYVDDELDLATAVRVEQHLAGCEGCQKAVDAARAVRAAAGQERVYYRAPGALRDRIKEAIRAEAREVEEPNLRLEVPWWRNRLVISGLAAALLVTLGVMTLFWPAGTATGAVDELVGAHVRSLEVSHLLDVESTDQHTVKPWFAGKIDFSPPVVDLAGDGFPLVGGRLDYVDQKKVAALVYRRNKHVINLFIWPGEEPSLTGTKLGFNLIRFECKGMVCWAVSDLNVVELQQFVDLFEAQHPASTRF